MDKQIKTTLLQSDARALPSYWCRKCKFGLDPNKPWIPRVNNPKSCPNCKSRDWHNK